MESKDSANGAASGLEADYAAVVGGAGVRIFGERKIVRVIGDDRVTFFHGMCSADVKGAAPGAILPALILTEHAHVIADLFIWVTDDALLLDIEAEAWSRARAHLERLLVADDVEFEDELELSIIDVEGPKAAAAVQLVAGEALSLEKIWSHNGKTSAKTSETIEMIVGRMPRYGAPAFSVIVPSATAASIVASMIDQMPAVRLIDATVTEIIRVENGIARIGVDTTDKTIALEARLNRAISFNKGCYVGQETIERATARGALKKRLRGLGLESIAERGAVVSLQGKEVGRLSSVAWSPRFGAIALAILHHSAWTPGTRVSIADSGGATVSDLPFA
ncbi:MAG: glycine cleavage T C-terminal barrel domain-containing protein [Candidatus Binatus sp.]|uniref:CAF17-like 4Fe-4S cluster assembly/insertion protein YgfZ n=1 Tax=Candidatus Binatus sp. TaxID=2811406 RepID=UPI0027290A02|nr:glycine cleavage T C-terminal barrel domain-containing protein [Candidatus Binatus sp.]MDO8433033.1 glycine cleavage T C-terminal barrel domain-containing protein [Candidatus Binatus sp.]